MLEVSKILELQRSLCYIEAGAGSWTFPNYKEAGLPQIPASKFGY